MIAVADRALHAARSNADLYQAMFGAHGLAYARDDHLFRALASPLPYYSAALVLQPGTAAVTIPALEQVLSRFDGGAAVKDGFATLDLRPLGLEVGFRARWIWADGPGSGPASWEVVSTAGDLALWEQGWKAGGSPTAKRMFPPACLASGKLVFCGQRVSGGFEAGCIVNLSGDVTGLSNVFGPQENADLFATARAMAAQVGGDCPIAGYERGGALDAALAAGFKDAGPLVVWFPRSGA